MASNEQIEKMDEDIETLKKELAELKSDHSEVTKRLRQDILDLQQSISILKVVIDSDHIRAIIQSQLPESGHLVTQMLLDEKEAKTKIRMSTNPIPIANQLYDKWVKILRDSGAKVILRA